MQNSHWNICECSVYNGVDGGGRGRKERQKEKKKADWSCAQLLSDSDQLIVVGWATNAVDSKCAVCVFDHACVVVVTQ